MKLICVPYQSPHFYLKPDTAILRNGQAFYMPDVCSRISGALALVIRINRLGRHIAPRFVYRYYHETALGFCLYAADLLEQCHTQGAPWASACALDYSAPLSNDFCLTAISPPQWDVFAWTQWSGGLTDSIEQTIASLSRYMFLKMGDLIWMELHPPLSLPAMTEIHASRNGDVQLRFSLR